MTPRRPRLHPQRAPAVALNLALWLAAVWALSEILRHV